jgi:hypothetical protein
VAGRLLLELSDLLSADDAGIALLRRLAAQGAELLGVSRYLEMLLDYGSSSEQQETRRINRCETRIWQ